MGGYFSVALVKEEQQTYVPFIDLCVEAIGLLFNPIQRVNFHYPLNPAGDHWRKEEKTSKDFPALLSRCCREPGPLSELQIDGVFHGCNLKGVLCHVEQIPGDSLGMHFYFPEKDCMRDFTLDEWEKFTEEYIVQAAAKGFSYGFSDFETHMEHPLREVMQGDVEYSILAIHDEGTIRVRYASWRCDGLTPRH